LHHKWITTHNPQTAQGRGSEVSAPEKAEILNRMEQYKETSSFFKMVVSCAIGNKLDTDTEQEDRLTNFFYTIDNNPDGVLTRKELIQLKDSLKRQDSSLRITDGAGVWEEVFNSIDLDGDGRADFHEFYAATIDHKKLLTEANLEKIFKLLDHNKNQVLTEDELHKAMPTNLNKEGQVRMQIRKGGPFFEANQEVGEADAIQAIEERW
jgi:Ca2+-binding EF-hand superfamily protein